MAQKPADPQKPRPVNLRLPAELFKVLDVARLASGHKSMQSFLSEVVTAAAEGYSDEPEIQMILQKMSEYQARKEGKLQSIEKAPRKAGRSK